MVIIYLDFGASYEQINWLEEHICKNNSPHWRSAHFTYEIINTEKLHTFKWLYDNRKVYFENEDDAVWFKLRWL